MQNDTQTIDQLIADLDAVMHGEQPGAAGAGDFAPEVMNKLRALVQAAMVG